MKKAYQQQEELKHFGVLGMHWGQRRGQSGTTGHKPRPAEVRGAIGGAVKKAGAGIADSAKAAVAAFKAKHASRVTIHPETKSIIDNANKILNNPKSSQKDLDSALASIGVDPKTGKAMRTSPIYDKNGNDVSVNPFTRLFKEKGRSDKDFDAEVAAEMNPKSEKLVGKPVKTLFGVRTEPVYDSSGNDVSSKPFGRPFKKKGQSDKDFDAEIDAENSDAPNIVAKRKVADLQLDHQAKVQMGVALATVGTIAVATYLGSQALKGSADASLVAKYGPTVANLIRKG